MSKKKPHDLWCKDENKRIEIIKRLGKMRPNLQKHIGKIISKPVYQGVFWDLIAFTGLNEYEIGERIMKRRGEKGHFISEHAWHHPRNEREVTYFYMIQQAYLYGNAERPYWEKLDILKKNEDSPILDFGGGVGTNSLVLAKKGFSVSYFDVSIIQREFVKFRAMRHGVQIDVIEPYYNFVYDPIRPLEGRTFGTIICQDVLEHIPEYPPVLKQLISCLRLGGKIVEYTPFNTKEAHGKKWKLHSPVHFEEKYNLEKVMIKYGMELVNRDAKNRGVWKKVKSGT